MKDLYKLALAFEKASQVRDPLELTTKVPPLPDNAIKEFVDPYIQYSLNNLGYPKPIVVDGLLGPETASALEWFKKNFGLTPTTPLASVMQQVKNEAGKLKGSKPSSQLAFKAPAPEPSKPGALSQDDFKQFDSADYVNPNSNHFTSNK